MSSKSDKLKSIVKGTYVKPTFGTNPMDPWSTKAGINESEEGLLKRYLLSRGIDPRYVTKDTRISHAKSGQFLKWKADHIADRVTEEVDNKDTITFDIPLIIRVMELAREDLKSDMDLHKVVEKLINIRNQGTLTMDDYEYISNIKEEVMSSVPLTHIKEALIELTEDAVGAEIKARHAAKHAELMSALKSGDKAKADKHNAELNKIKSEYANHSAKMQANKPTDAITQDYKDQEARRGIGHVRDDVEVSGQPLEETSKEKANEYMWSAKSDRQRTDDQINKEVEKQGSGWSKRRHNKISKLLNRSTKRTTGINRALDRLNKEETELAEAKEANYGGDYQQSVLAVKAKAEKKPVDMKSLAARMQASYAKDKKSVKENTLDGATEQTSTGDGSCNCNPNNEKQKLSKSASIVKAIYKQHRVSEDTYDHEKDDKSIATYGKKPKVDKMDKDAVPEKSKIQAAAVLSGGKTLTGEPRDTVEIDPIMRVRPGQPDPTKNEKK